MKLSHRFSTVRAHVPSQRRHPARTEGLGAVRVHDAGTGVLILVAKDRPAYRASRFSATMPGPKTLGEDD